MIETRLLRIGAPDDPAIELGILEKRSPALDVRLPPILLLHGATFGARLFDLPRAGYSLMTEFASEGRAAYALDIRGFGSSLGGAAMAEPPFRNPPFAGVDEAVKDISAAVDFILKRRSVAGLDLVGFSWGTVAAARYAGDNPDKVAFGDDLRTVHLSPELVAAPPLVLWPTVVRQGPLPGDLEAWVIAVSHAV